VHKVGYGRIAAVLPIAGVPHGVAVGGHERFDLQARPSERLRDVTAACVARSSPELIGMTIMRRACYLRFCWAIGQFIAVEGVRKRLSNRSLPPVRLCGPDCHDHVGHGFGGAKLVAVNWISVIALRLRAP
jgi:hypothetical protein